MNLPCGYKAAVLSALLFSTPLRADPSVMDPRAGATSAYVAASHGGTALVAAALRDVGATSPQLGLPSSLSCGDVVNRWRRKAGLRAVPSRRAIDQARYGVRLSRPETGSLMITSRRGGHHVDVVASVHGDGTITVVRPNWTRRVQIQRIRPARGLFIRPI